jgi:hypothetical protein
LYVALYSATNDLQPTGSPVVSWSAITVATGVTGRYAIDITPTTLQSGVYVLAVNASVGFTVQGYRSPSQLPITVGNQAVVTGLQRSRTAGAFSTAQSWNAFTTATSTTSAGLIVPFFLQWDAA